jgi:arylsulfatase A-like enzyme/Flp pilus assembly protein TadD
MSRKKRRTKKSPASDRAQHESVAAEKKKARRSLQGRKPGVRPGLIWCIFGAVAALALLLYFLAIRPQRGRANLPDASALNVLLITLDTTRADHLGCYGYPAAKTPSLDGLAREGIRFARVYCPAPMTLPSHISILSGLYPVTHGVRNNGHVLAAGIKTLAEILKGRGYATAAFVSSFSVDSRFGIDRGFDVYDDTFQSQVTLKSTNAERRAEETFDRFSRWLETNGSNRFFGWVHYYDPHLPYDPPSPYREEFGGRLYDGEIAYMDHYVGAILERLRTKGILERTIIIAAGDHGEGLGDKVEKGHGIFLYEEDLRVPLIFYNPGVFPRPRVVESTVRLVDVAPTILELIGLKDDAAGMQGQSLVPRLKGKAGKDLNSLIETFYPRESFGWSELVGVISGPWKLIQAPRPELYDLKTDPWENRNLYGVEADKAAALKTKLENELLQLGSGGKASREPAVTRAEDLEKLRSLGYVNFAPAKPTSVFPDPKDKIDILKLIQQAQAFEYEQQYPEAERVYGQILKEIPDSPAAYVNLAILQAMQKKFDQATETLNLGIARIPDSEILMVRLGHTYLVTGKSEAALETMKKVLALYPRNMDALTVCATTLDQTGRTEEARTYYERGLAVEPESRYLRTNYAGNLASSGKFREAIKVYETLIADFPEEQGFYQYIGIAYSYLGEYDKAVSYLSQAVAIGPTPVGFFNLAIAYEKSGNPAEAAECLRRYLDNPQGESEANIRRARAELERLEKRPDSR